MSNDLELVHGSGNVFRDFGHPDAEILQLKAILAGKIIDVLDARNITVRRAHELTGFAAADFSRVRQAKLQRFTLDRLIAMLSKLDRDIEVSIDVRPRRRLQPAAIARKQGHVEAVTRPWSTEETKSLRAYARQNTPTRVIGLKLQRPESAVRAKAQREGISLQSGRGSPGKTGRRA